MNDSNSQNLSPPQAQHGEHPIFARNVRVGIMSGANPYIKEMESGDGHSRLLKEIHDMALEHGIEHVPTRGKYTNHEPSVIVYNPTREQMFALGRKYGQESVVFGENGRHELLYTNGPNTGKRQLNKPEETVVVDKEPEDNFTVIPNYYGPKQDGYLTLSFDWGTLHDGGLQGQHAEEADRIRQKHSTSPEQAVMGKSEAEHTVPQALKEIASALKKYAEQNQEGFGPLNQKVPLDVALGQVHQAAHNLGLVGPNDPPKKFEGSYPVADEKEYSISEVRLALAKAMKDRVEKYAEEMRTLRTRELQKSEVATSSTKGFDLEWAEYKAKVLKKSATMETQKNLSMGYGEQTTNPPAGGALSLSEPSAKKNDSSILCKKCNKSHPEMQKCGLDGMAKSDSADKYNYYLVHKETGKVVGGNEYKEDAHDAAKDHPEAANIKVSHHTKVSPEAKKAFHGANKISGKLHKEELREKCSKSHPEMEKCDTAEVQSGKDSIKKSVASMTVHDSKAAKPPKGADYSSKQVGSTAVYDAKKPGIFGMLEDKKKMQKYSKNEGMEMSEDADMSKKEDKPDAKKAKDMVETGQAPKPGQRRGILPGDKPSKKVKIKDHGSGGEIIKKSKLEKGDVIKFPGNPAPAADQGKPAQVKPFVASADCELCNRTAKSVFEHAMRNRAPEFAAQNIERLVGKGHRDAFEAKHSMWYRPENRADAHQTLAHMLHSRHAPHVKKSEDDDSEDGEDVKKADSMMGKVKAAAGKAKDFLTSSNQKRADSMPNHGFNKEGKPAYLDKADAPMAKPPSGKNMATATPVASNTSKPGLTKNAAPKLPGMNLKAPKVKMPKQSPTATAQVRANAPAPEQKPPSNEK